MASDLPAPPRAVTPAGILSFPSLIEKREFNGKMRYDCRLFFPIGTDMSKLEAAQEEALEARFGKGWAKDRKIKLAIGIAGEGNNMHTYDGVEEGMPSIGVWSEKAISLVSNERDDNGLLRTIDDASEAEKLFYPGAKARATVTALTYDYQGSKGVRFALDGVQFLGHGERIGGGTRDVRRDFDDGGADDDLLD